MRMDITPYVESLRRDLVAAAEAAGPEARDATERLAFALDPAARLALMEAVSQAAAEITAEMANGGGDRPPSRLGLASRAAPGPPSAPSGCPRPSPPRPRRPLRHRPRPTSPTSPTATSPGSPSAARS